MTNTTGERTAIIGGVDTHQDLHTAAVVDLDGAVLGCESFSTTRAGYRAMLRWLRSHGELLRVGVESTGSYGAGISRHLALSGTPVLEVTGPDRAGRRAKGKDDSLDAMAESFFATLECELIDRRSFRTRAQAKREVFDFVEGWYNPGRRHSALGYLSPNDFERTAAGPQPAFAPRPNARPEAPNHPPHRLPTPVHEETSTLSALAHHHTPGESHQPSTRSG